MAEPLPVIVNGAAGTGHTEADCEKLKQVFHDVGLQTRILPARSGEELRAIAEREVARKPVAIVAGGGDGTINTVASTIAGSSTALGVLPLGTLNHFAKDLQIPLDIPEAARTIAAGHVRNVDVGEVNGRFFINNSSLGLYPQIVRHREEQKRRLGRGKWPALFWATWTTLRRSPFLTVRLSLDGREQQFRSTFVFVGNNEYVMEGFNIGARERLDAGRLSVYVTQRRGRLGLLMLALRALFGRLRQAKDFGAATAHTIAVETRHRHLMVATDGEVTLLNTPLLYRIRPHALRVITPSQSAPRSE
jgi:diacylglycerol kinase family enzyme